MPMLDVATPQWLPVLCISGLFDGVGLSCHCLSSKHINLYCVRSMIKNRMRNPINDLGDIAPVV